MMKHWFVALAMATALGSVACQKEGAAESAGRQIDNAVQEIQDGVDGALKDVGKGVDDAVEKARKAAEGAAQELGDALDGRPHLKSGSPN
jgi:F0F1-type ATP synthase membrane subunit b/b'